MRVVFTGILIIFNFFVILSTVLHPVLGGSAGFRLRHDLLFCWFCSFGFAMVNVHVHRSKPL